MTETAAMNLRAYMKSNGLTYHQMAERVGLTHSTIHKAAHNVHGLRLTTATALSREVGMRLDEFVGFEEQPTVATAQVTEGPFSEMTEERIKAIMDEGGGLDIDALTVDEIYDLVWRMYHGVVMANFDLVEEEMPFEPKLREIEWTPAEGLKYPKVIMQWVHGMCSVMNKYEMKTGRPHAVAAWLPELAGVVSKRIFQEESGDLVKPKGPVVISVLHAQTLSDDMIQGLPLGRPSDVSREAEADVVTSLMQARGQMSESVLN